MKVNLDLTSVAAENYIEDDYYLNVGSPTFILRHDYFYGEEKLEIWTAAGQTGTQLSGTDYSLGGIDEDLTERAERNIYTNIQITNPTYQSGDLYFTYQACGDLVDADDRYQVYRTDEQYWKLNFAGGFELYSSDTSANSILIDSSGGFNLSADNSIVIDTTSDININSDNGFSLQDDSGAGIVASSAGDLTLDDQYLTSAISLSESGTTGLSGFTAISIVSAINEVKNEAVPSGGAINQVLTKDSSTSYDTSWQSIEEVPAGGTVGQVLTKNSSTDNDTSWQGVKLPIGFIYFQLPGKDSPSTLGLAGTWSNVSTSWPGDFLRIEGGNASTFNSGQQANQNKTHTHVQDSHIHTMPTHRHNSGWVLASSDGSYNVYGVKTVTTQGNSLGGSTNSGPYAAYTSTNDPGDTHSKTATNQTEGGTESWPNNRTIRVWERVS